MQAFTQGKGTFAMPDQPKESSRSPRLHDRIRRHGRRFGLPCHQRQCCQRAGRTPRRRGAEHVTGNRLYRRHNPREESRQHARHRRSSARQEALIALQGAQMPTGQHWNVSVIVAKGVRPGKRITLTSGVHGDEFPYPHGLDGDEPARPSGHVGDGHGRPGRRAPCCRKHATQMAQLGEGYRSYRHELRVARERERRQRNQPSRGTAFQQIAETEF